MSDRLYEYENSLRLDFTVENLVEDDSDRITYGISFSRERYDIAEIQGERMLFDKLDELFIPLEMAMEIVAKSFSKNPTGKPATLGNADEYVEQRLEELRQEEENKYHRSYSLVDKSDDYLASIEDGPKGFAILSVDIVGSTKLSSALSVEQNASVIKLAVSEMAKVVPHFHGHVLKYTGDGMIAYFPPDSFILANDHALDCGVTLRKIIYGVVNTLLRERELPQLEVRVGIESGEAVALTIGHSDVKEHRDLIGKTINLACKIQSAGKSGDIYLGMVAYKNMHTIWKRNCKRVDAGHSWNYKTKEGKQYVLYEYCLPGWQPNSET